MTKWLLYTSKEVNPTIFLGNLSQCLVNLTSKKCFLIFIGNLLCFSLCPLPLILSLGITEKSLALSFFHPLQVFTHTNKIPLEPSLLQAKQSQLSQIFLTKEMLQSLCRLCGPLLNSSSCSEEPRSGHSTPHVNSPVLSRG